MFFSVLLCFLVNALIPLCSTFSQEAQYECGPHGKFEYCIDGIPGCVIGCHCHPGYYFDTDTKICEPNIKLTHHFRRHYLTESPRADAAPAYTPTVTDEIPTTTDNNMNKKVDEIGKDTDELGDWLYNQFFKTIENQVINKSNNTNTDNKQKRPTRRSSGGIKTVINKSRRKKSKKKKRMKAHGLRRKLLHITEDDSLFDSESESESSASSSASDSESRSDTASEDSSDCKKSREDQEHGHRKVIIFNKRPKPPLPSFIFLPSMDTPYYPPIGLPLPPPMPMYPMVPIPPMAPPIFPFLAPPEEKNATSTTAVVTTTTTTQTTTTAHTTTKKETVSESNPVFLRLGDRRSRLGRQQNRKLPEEFIAHSREIGKKATSKRRPQNKQTHKLRDRMMEKRRNTPLSDTQIPDEFLDGKSLNIGEVPPSSEAFMPPNGLPERNSGEHIPKLEDVDFTYLSELIHRVNQSDSRGNRLPPMPFDLNEDLKELQKIKSQYTRRSFSPYYVAPENFHPETNQHRNLKGSDDVYYTNLGRQIASMIRSADSKADHQINKDVAQVNGQVPFHSVLNENSYSPRSFFERSVRSPLTQIGVFRNYLDESRTLKHSYVNTLFNLENEVETFVNTPAPLGLQDFENILNTMQRAHARINYNEPVNSIKQSNISLNINLLPKYIRTENINSRLFIAPGEVDYITERYLSPSPPNLNVKMQAANATNTTIFYESNRNYWMFNNNQNPRPVFVPQMNQSLVRDHQKYNTNPTRHPFVADVRATNTVTQKPREYLQFLRSMPVIKQTTVKRPASKFQLNSPVVNFKSMNYFTGNKHHYMFEESTFPLDITPFKRRISKPFDRSMKPSYFHHEFDYFN